MQKRVKFSRKREKCGRERGSLLERERSVRERRRSFIGIIGMCAEKREESGRKKEKCV